MQLSCSFELGKQAASRAFDGLREKKLFTLMMTPQKKFTVDVPPVSHLSHLSICNRDEREAARPDQRWDIVPMF